MNKKPSFRSRLSPISGWHLAKFFFRIGLFSGTAALYLLHSHSGSSIDFTKTYSPFLFLLWFLFAAETLRRFFPSSRESMGCQKQFSKNYIPTSLHPDASLLRQSMRRQAMGRFLTAFVWITVNLGFGLLYRQGYTDRGFLILLCLFYSVCDIFCILIYCAFQKWFLINRCCMTCLIYNWDYPMMFTPLLFVGGIPAWSLLGLGIALLIKWELDYHRHPERFFQEWNLGMKCINCKEKLCLIKACNTDSHPSGTAR